jgi:hypothetical protein
MAYAIKNLDLNIKRPGVEGKPIVFTSVATTGDHLRIPRRYPFADIVDYATLKSEGFFRHATTTVSSDLGGSSTADTEGNLGFQLPNTEKLILLLKRNGVASTGTAKLTITIEGSAEYGIEDKVIEIAADETFTSGTEIREIDLYDFGLYITGIPDEKGLMIKVETTDTISTVGLALIARMG